MMATQMSVYSIGFCNDQTFGGGRLPVFPNASRTACDTADTGFHSEKVWSTPGRLWTWTKVLAMNVNGKMTMNEALFTTSTFPTFKPTNAMIQENAYAKTSSRRYPPIASTAFVWIRQPTTKPARDMTRIDAEL